MSEFAQTLNDVPEDSSPFEFDESLVSTVDQPVEDTEPEGANNTEGEKEQVQEEAETVAEEKQEKQPEKQPEETRFDQHPRFRELNERMIRAETEAKLLREQMQSNQQKPPQEQQKTVMDMSEEEIADAFDDNPKAFLAQFAQAIRQDVMNEFQGRQSQEEQSKARQDWEQRVNSTFNSYAEKNPEFLDKWNSGELKAFMNANPGHNAISAYQILTEEDRIAAAVAKAEKETREKVLKEIKAKSHASTLDAGPSGTRGQPVDDELKNPDKYGGAESVLLRRLKARMSA